MTRRLVALLLVFVVGVGVGYAIGHQGGDAYVPPDAAVPRPSAEGTSARGLLEPPTSPEDEGPAPGPALGGTQPAAAHEEAGSDGRPRVASDGRVEVLVRVLGPDGVPPPSAEIRWGPEPNPSRRQMRRQRWSPPESAVFVEPGEAWLHAIGGTYGDLRSEEVRVRVVADDPRQVAHLTLAEPEGAAIRGRVRLPTWIVNPSPEVRLLRYEGAEPPASPVFDRRTPSQRTGASDGHAYAFGDLRPGGYLLGLFMGGDVPLVLEDVRVEDRPVEQDLVLEELDSERFMTVTVVGPDGRVLDDAQASVGFSGSGMVIGGGNVSLRREDGALLVDHIPGYTLQEDGTYAEGVFTLTVRTRDHGDQQVRYDPATTRALTVRMGEMQEVSVRVVDYASLPETVSVALRMVGETGVRNPRVPGPDGMAHFGERAPGSYEVVLMHAGRSPLAVHPVELAPGESLLEVPAPALHRLEVRVPPGAADPVFSLRRKFRTSTWTIRPETDAPPGRILFDHLAEGTYQLQGHYADRWVQREIRIPATTVVLLE